MQLMLIQGLQFTPKILLTFANSDDATKWLVANDFVTRQPPDKPERLWMRPKSKSFITFEKGTTSNQDGGSLLMEINDALFATVVIPMSSGHVTIKHM